jgi:WbqC-like protein family
MQPYFLPYIGYYQLIAGVDVFVMYDNIKYTKKGWINRNRILRNGADATFSLPLKKDSDSLDVVQRELATDFNRDKLLNQFKGAYARAPYFASTFALLERIVHHEERNLFRYIHYANLSVCAHLGVTTETRVSSQIPIDHSLRGEDRVITLCKALGVDTYINAIGGMELYSRDEFRARGIELKFIKSRPFEYAQFGEGFVPWLSIVDVMMFNSRDQINKYIIRGYALL